MLYLRWLPVGSCTLLQRGNGWIPLPLFSVCACGAISSDPDPNLKERGIFYASYHYPPPVPESRRRRCCFHSGSRPAEQLRQLVRFRQLHRRLRQQHLHRFRRLSWKASARWRRPALWLLSATKRAFRSISLYLSPSRRFKGRKKHEISGIA